MQILINIRDDYFEALKKSWLVRGSRNSGKLMIYSICDAIVNGVQIPKDHGRMIIEEDGSIHEEVSRCPEIEKSEIDNVISKLDRCMECMMESDHRSFSNRETEDGWIFDHILEWRKMIRPYIKD